MSDPNKPLSDKHKEFVNIYTQNGRNATKAYKEVYQLDNDDSAGKAGHRLLKNVEKHPYFVEKSAEVEKSCGVSFKWFVSELLDSLEVYKGRKKVVKSYTDGDKEVFMHNPQSADSTLDKLAKTFGYYKETAMKLELAGQGKDGAFELLVKREIIN